MTISLLHANRTTRKHNRASGTRNNMKNLKVSVSTVNGLATTNNAISKTVWPENMDKLSRQYCPVPSSGENNQLHTWSLMLYLLILANKLFASSCSSLFLQTFIQATVPFLFIFLQKFINILIFCILVNSSNYLFVYLFMIPLCSCQTFTCFSFFLAFYNLGGNRVK